jgi:hypothetical protein
LYSYLKDTYGNAEKKCVFSANFNDFRKKYLKMGKKCITHNKNQTKKQPFPENNKSENGH